MNSAWIGNISNIKMCSSTWQSKHYPRKKNRQMDLIKFKHFPRWIEATGLEKLPANHTFDTSLISRGNKVLPKHNHKCRANSTRKWANIRRRYFNNHITAGTEAWDGFNAGLPRIMLAAWDLCVSQVAGRISTTLLQGTNQGLSQLSRKGDIRLQGL